MAISRELIYEEKSSIEAFGINNKGTLNHLLYKKWLLYLPDLRPDLAGFSDRKLAVFNDAYYICTIILMIKSCDQYLNYYLQQTKIPSVVIPMVYLFVSRLNEQTQERIDLLKVIEAATKIHEDWHQNLKNLKKTVKSNKHGIANSTFSRRGYTSEFLSGIDWREKTDNYNEKQIRIILRNLVKSEEEKAMIIEAIRNAIDKEENDYLNPKPDYDELPDDTISIDDFEPDYYCELDFFSDKRTLLGRIEENTPVRKIEAKPTEQLLDDSPETQLSEFELLVVEPKFAGQVVQRIHDLMKNQNGPKNKLMPIRAAMDAGVLKRPTWGQFTSEFGEYLIKSKTSLSNMTNPNNQPYFGEAYETMKKSFRDLIEKE